MIDKNQNIFYVHINSIKNLNSIKLDQSQIIFLSDIQQNISLLQKTDLFDSKFYLYNNKDLYNKNINPFEHFANNGWKEGRIPSLNFSLQYYIENNIIFFKKYHLNPLIVFLVLDKNKKNIIEPLSKNNEISFINIINNYIISDITDINNKVELYKNKKIAVVFHLFYIDLFNEIVEYLYNIPIQFTLYITYVDSSININDLSNKLKNIYNCKKYYFILSKNIGRDIGPMFVEISKELLKYDFICKIQTKKDDKLGWRQYLLKNLLGSKDIVQTILNNLSYTNIGMIFPTPLLEHMFFIKNGIYGKNGFYIKDVIKKIYNKDIYLKQFLFPCGSMFWAKIDSIKQLLLQNYTYDDFGKINDFLFKDGSFAHAMERLFGLVQYYENYKIKTIHISNISKNDCKITKRYIQISDDKLNNNIEIYWKNHNKNNKVAIFTCFINSQNTLKIPEYIDNDFDYYYFSDIPILGLSNWIYIPIQYWNIDLNKILYFYKTHPFLFFEKYDYVIWIDSNILLLNNILKQYLENFKKICFNGIPIGLMSHPERQCIYDEAKTYKLIDKNNIEIINEQIKQYLSDGFPKYYGLAETNIYILAMHFQSSKKLMNDWWNQLSRWSNNDQISLQYVLWKNKFNYYKLVKSYEETTRYSTNFAYYLYNSPTLDYPNIYINPKLNGNLVKSKIFSISKKEDDILKIKNKNFIISIIILIFNQLEYECFKKSIDSILNDINKEIDFFTINLILIINSFNDKILQYLYNIKQKYNLVFIIENKQNLGDLKLINKAILYKKADYYIILNGNIIVSQNWIYKQILLAESNEYIGIVSPIFNNIDLKKSSNIDFYENNIEKINSKCEQIVKENDIQYPFLYFINDQCMCIKNKIIQKFGLFIEDNNIRNNMINYCIQLYDNGYINILAIDTYIYYYNSIKIDFISYLTSINLDDLNQKDKKNIIQNNINNKIKNIYLEQLQKFLNKDFN